MDELAIVITFGVELLKYPFTIWGFTLSFWDILIWSIIAEIIILLIVRYFDD